MGRRTVLAVALACSACGCSLEKQHARSLSKPERPHRASLCDWAFRTSLRPMHGSSAARRHDLHVAALRVMPAVVYVTTVPQRPDSARQPTATCWPTRSRYGGTGVIISDNGAILTSAHVVEDATAVIVTLGDGSECPVHRVTLHPTYDLAVLHTGVRGLRPLIPAARGTAEGAAVVALCGRKPGQAFRPGERTRVGMVEGTSRSLQHLLAAVQSRDYSHLIETTADLDPGFSGGPLLNAEGRLVGINVAAIPKNETHGPRGYAVPVNQRTIRSIELAGFESELHRIRPEGGRSLPGTSVPGNGVFVIFPPGGRTTDSSALRAEGQQGCKPAAKAAGNDRSPSGRNAPVRARIGPF